MSMSVPTSIHPSAAPLRERINLRVIIFVAVFVALLGWPLYLYLDATLSGGLKNRGDYYEVDLKAMSDFVFNQNEGTVDDIPKKWRDLNGKTVVMEGEEAPSSMSANGVGQQFQLVYSVQKCCFSGPPQVQHFINVTVPPTAQIGDLGTGGSLRVKGKLIINLTRDETGKVTSLYHVVADGVSAV